MWLELVSSGVTCFIKGTGLYLAKKSDRIIFPFSGIEAVAEQCGTSISTMQLIVEGLAQPLDYDIRAQFEKPLFRKGITSIDDVTAGTKLTGKLNLSLFLRGTNLYI